MPDDPFAPDHVFLEIGSRDDFAKEDIAKAARAFALSVTIYPKAIHTLVVGGYDDDPREVWQIPEARDAFVLFAGWALNLLPGVPIHEWRLDDTTKGILAMCSGVGRAVRNPAGGWTITVP